MIPDGGAGSPALLPIAWQASAVLAGIIALLVLQILAAGLWLERKRRRSARIRESWEPILAAAALEPQADLPPLRSGDMVTFLRLWNYLQALLLSDATLRLNEVARRVGAESAARRLIRSRRLRDRLVAITAVGHLRDDSAWPELAMLARSADPVRSLAAIRSQFRIDPDRAASELIPEIARRPDWPLAGLAGILAGAGPDAISEPLARAALTAPPGQEPRLIRLLELAHGPVAVPVVRRIIATATETDVITACLRVFRDPDDLGTVRTLMTDDRWPVRLHAAGALGRMGTEEDVARLVIALEDDEWWVRYRAAQALAGLPFVEPERLHRLARELPGRFARDILRQVMAERELSC